MSETYRFLPEWLSSNTSGRAHELVANALRIGAAVKMQHGLPVAPGESENIPCVLVPNEPAEDHHEARLGALNPRSKRMGTRIGGACRHPFDRFV